MKDKILDIKQLQLVTQKLKKEHKKIVATSGCFDLLHAGHVTYLEEAKNIGDVLVVLLNSDQSVHRLKGETRPIVPEKERAQVIAGLGCVDYVCIFDEQTPCEKYLMFQPDYIVKGGDYQGKTIPEMETVATYGGKIAYLSFVEGHSTTNIIEKIKQLVKDE